MILPNHLLRCHQKRGPSTYHENDLFSNRHLSSEFILEDSARNLHLHIIFAAISACDKSEPLKV